MLVAARTAGADADDVPLDLGDLDDVVRASEAIAERLGGVRLDVVVLNAGIAPRVVGTGPQGHETAFAVNVLGHHVLIERLIAAGAVAPGARVVVVTGDIYLIARDCTPDFASTHRRAGTMAYARSKLGSIWLAREMATRHPGLEVVAVHPGVVRSGLGAIAGGTRWQRLTHIRPERSAETVLLAALSDEVSSGDYVHNTLGRVRLRPDDAALDAERARAFVDLLDELGGPWLSGG